MCELQIHHKDIKHWDKRLHSHAYYEYFRTFFKVTSLTYPHTY